jgi:arsenate reductase-like glutaredoxin family protein
MILYGIPTCDTCKKALKALKAAGHEVEFRNLRAPAMTAEDWAPLIEHFGPAIINRNSPTWRGLSDWMRESEPEAQLLEHPTLMKRPLIRDGARMTIGWDAAAQAVWL